MFTKSLVKKKFKKITSIEIDKKICKKNTLNKSFVSYNFKEKYDVIIGNPPYVRWKNLNITLKNELEKNSIWKENYNSLCDYLYIFVHKSLEILNDNGELIFITPEYWFKNLHSRKLRNYIIKNAHLSEVYYLSERRFFKNVNSSFIIFKIIKKKINPKIKIFKLKNDLDDLELAFLDKERNFENYSIDQFKPNNKWLLHNQKDSDLCRIIENRCKNDKSKDLFGNYDYFKLKDVAQIANGLVSGLDKAFICNKKLESKLNKKEKNAVVKIVKAFNIKKFKNDKFVNYIFLNNTKVTNLKSQYPNFYNHFKKFKSNLKKRYNYNRNINYWDWVFLRSYNLISSNKDKICIPCKLRITKFEDINFSFVGKKFLLTQDVTSIYLKQDIKENIIYFLGLLNSKYIKKWIFLNNNNRGNVLEFSEAPLNNIPIKLINWKNENEVKAYNNILSITKNILINHNKDLLKNLDCEVKILLNL